MASDTTPVQRLLGLGELAAVEAVALLGPVERNQLRRDIIALHRHLEQRLIDSPGPSEREWAVINHDQRVLESVIVRIGNADEARRLLWSWPNRPIPLAALRARTPRTRQAIAEKFLGESDGWLMVRGLMASGELQRPADPRYVVGWLIAQPALVDELAALPDFLSTDFWELFVLEGDGTGNLTKHDTQNGLRYSDALVELAARGLLPRSRLLDASLAALARDFTAYHAKWYAAFHEQLRPTIDELSERGNTYLRLCHSTVPRTVALAVRALRVLHGAARLDVAAIDHLAPATLTSTKAVALQAIRLIGALATRENADRAAAALEPATSDERRDVADLARRVLGKLGVASPAPSAPTIPARRYPEPDDSRTTPPRPFVLPAGWDDPDVVARTLSELMADGRDARIWEVCLAGLCRLSGDPRLPGALQPLVPRSIPSETEWGWTPSRWGAELVCAGTGPWRRPNEGEGQWASLWTRRVLEVCRVLQSGRPQTMASLPSYDGGGIDPTRAPASGIGKADRLIAGLRVLEPSRPIPAWTVSFQNGREPELFLTPSVPTGVDWAFKKRHPWGRKTNWHSFVPTSQVSLLQWTLPNEVDALDARFAVRLHDNLHWDSVDWDEPLYSSRLFTTPDPPRLPARILLALGLGRREPATHQVAVDAVVRLLDDDLLGPLALGEALAACSPVLSATRLMNTLPAIATEHPHAVRTALGVVLPCYSPGARGLIGLMETYEQLLEWTGTAVEPSLEAWLASFSGSGKAATIARRLRLRLSQARG